MPPSGLTELQSRLLELLADVDPPWTLTGGAALVALHGVERTTRDLDLFFHGRSQLGELPDEVVRCLRAAGLEVTGLRSSDAFRSFRVSDGRETVIVDLVADPVEVVEEPATVRWGQAEFLADTAHEILVNKLCSLVHRSELRDLADVRSLLASGGDLERALLDAPRKDGGFSPMTLAWLLRELAIDSMTALEGWDSSRASELARFREELVHRIMRLAKPDGSA